MLFAVLKKKSENVVFKGSLEQLLILTQRKNNSKRLTIGRRTQRDGLQNLYLCESLFLY